MAKEVVITYETLYELLRIEKQKLVLQALPPAFYEDLVNYISEKKAILESQMGKDSIFASSEAQKTRKQLENVHKIVKELYERRESKILQIALFSSRSGDVKNIQNMSPEEIRMFEQARVVLDGFRTNILVALLAAKTPVIPAENKSTGEPVKKPDLKLVRFIHEVPRFIGDDLNVYGPFEMEDVASLPVKTASLLVERKRAEEIKVN